MKTLLVLLMLAFAGNANAQYFSLIRTTDGDQKLSSALLQTGGLAGTAHGLIITEGPDAAYTSTSAGTSGYVLKSLGASADPVWVALTNSLISDTVPVAKGGTGLKTVTGYLKGTGTANLSVVTNISVADGGTGGTTIPTAQNGIGIVSPTALAADTATTGQTLIGCPTALQFTIGTAGTYRFRAVLNVGNSGTNGTEVGILLPASATMKVFANGNTNAITAWTSDIITASHTVGATFNTSAISTALIYLDGIVTAGGTGGQVVIQFDAKTSGTATVKAGSFLWVQQTS